MRVCCVFLAHALCWKWTEIRVCCQVRTLTGRTGAVFSVAFSPDGKRVVGGSADNRVHIWDVATGAEVSSTANGSGFRVERLAFRVERLGFRV